MWMNNEKFIPKCEGLLETLKLFGSFLVARTVHRQVKSSKNVLCKKKKKTDLEVLAVNFGTRLKWTFLSAIYNAEDADIEIYSGLCVVEELSCEISQQGNIPGKHICCIGEVASALKQDGIIWMPLVWRLSQEVQGYLEDTRILWGKDFAVNISGCLKNKFKWH